MPAERVAAELSTKTAKTEVVGAPLALDGPVDATRHDDACRGEVNVDLLGPLQDRIANARLQAARLLPEQAGIVEAVDDGWARDGSKPDRAAPFDGAATGRVPTTRRTSMKLASTVVLATLSLASAPASSGGGTPRLLGQRTWAGSACYIITRGDKPVGTTSQTVTARTEDGRRVWDVVVHQKVAAAGFDMRDHFVLDRNTLLPIRFESAAGRDVSARGYHRIELAYGNGRIRGTRETAEGKSPIDVAVGSPVWEGNLWGVTFAALPLRAGGTYSLPFWQYDKGLGAFTIRVVGEEKVSTPAGKVDAWILEGGADPSRLARYQIAKTSRQELGYAAGPSGQRLGGNCGAGG